VTLTDLSSIPGEIFKAAAINSDADKKAALKGAIVFNMGVSSGAGSNIPAGIYVWNGYHWSPDGSYNPIITPSPSSAFTVYSDTGYADLAVTVGGRPPFTYTWYKTTASSATGGNQVGTEATYLTPTGLEEGIYYYYCTIKSGYNDVEVTSDLFTVTVSFCTGAVVFNGAYDGPSEAGGLDSPFNANWSSDVFTAQHKDLCWAATDISDPQLWTNAEKACAALTTDGASWRLPNLMELHVLYKAFGGNETEDSFSFTNLGVKTELQMGLPTWSLTTIGVV
jgi:hypothetical protein